MSPLLRLRNRHFLALDAFLLTAGVAIIYFLRYESSGVTPERLEVLGWYLLLSVPARLAVFWALGLYDRLWRHAAVADLERIVLAGLVGWVVAALIGIVLLPVLGLTAGRIPLSITAFELLQTIAAPASTRLLVRAMAVRLFTSGPVQPPRPVLIVGAGAAGEQLAKQLRQTSLTGLRAIGFVDDDPEKLGRFMVGLPVLGSIDEIPDLVVSHPVAEVLIAMPSAHGRAIRRVVRCAGEAGVPARILPGISALASGKVTVSALRDVRIEDLLRREPIRTDLDEVRAMVAGKVVLVTGAGGSIGSELVRQVAALGPERVILLDQAEHVVFEIATEMIPRAGEVKITPVVADVRDRRHLDSIFARHLPSVVFHAAAHKHVPLMELNALEAVRNNVGGALNVAELCIQHEVARLVLISTDKAVRPTSVMGATKRVAEQVGQDLAARHGRNIVSVRFGNVLGSRGSVVPTFLRQIRQGGPVTVTHPEMRRYFMTIPEAVQLVLQAAVLGKGGEVFALDMGEPVRVADLAADLIRLSGLEVGDDIDIVYTGIRPGEKLYEEVFFSGELAEPTTHPKVLRSRQADVISGFEEALDRLLDGAKAGFPESEMRKSLHAIVPDYAPDQAEEQLMNRRSPTEGNVVN